ncbi:MAG: cytidine deaminase [Candidatus Shapirobacteria bacterium]|jgi:cytidine deaminase
MNKLSEIEIKKMIAVAIEARGNAFAPKSKHKIGACILTTDGEYFGGCNTEGIISSLGVCAEMSAIDHAVVHGKYEFRALAVVDEKITYPCGACRQYLGQFYQVNDEDIPIIVAKENGEYKISSLLKLLPEVFLTTTFKEKIRAFKK